MLEKGPAISILEQGDIILEFNYKKVDVASDLPIIVGGTPTDRDIDVKIRREGRTQIVKLRLAELPPPKVVAKKQRRPKIIMKADTVMGMELDNLTLNSRKELKIKDGILVASVGLGAAHKAGIQMGDIIRKFNGESIITIKQFKLLANSFPNTTPVAALVLRDGTAQFVAFMIEHEEKSQ